MSAVLVTWHDYVRLALYALQIVLGLLVLKLICRRGRWKRPWDGEGPLLVALLSFLVVLSQVRTNSLGSGSFAQGWPTIVNVVGYVFLLLWLRQRITWHRSGRQERRRQEKLMAANDANEKKKPSKPAPVEDKSWPPKGLERK